MNIATDVRPKFTKVPTSVTPSKTEIHKSFYFEITLDKPSNDTVTTLYDEYIDWQKLTEQKTSRVYSSSTTKVGRNNKILEENRHLLSSPLLAIFTGTDKEGRRIIWMYMNRIKRTKGDLDIWSRYFVYHLEKLFQQRGTQRLIFVNDLSGVGITNFDYELTGFAVKLFENHYPDLLTFQVNYNMAWTLKTAWNIIKTWMTPEAIARVKFVKNDELQQYVCSEFIPTHMGGQFK